MSDKIIIKGDVKKELEEKLNKIISRKNLKIQKKY